MKITLEEKKKEQFKFVPNKKQSLDMLNHDLTPSIESLEHEQESLHISQPDSKIWKKVRSSIKNAYSDNVDDQADNVMDTLHSMQDIKQESADIELLEAKADQEAFINKFGEKSFDSFKRLKDRLKNKNISIDLTYHVKNTSPEEMEEILYNADKRIEDRSEEENKTFVAENENYTVYEIHNHQTAMKYGDGTRWCITGRYGDGDYNKKTDKNPKVSQAVQYFYDYLKSDCDFYLFAIPKNKRDHKYCICPKITKDSFSAVIWDEHDNSYIFTPASSSNEAVSIINSLPEISYKGFSTAVKDFVIINNVLMAYNGRDDVVTIPDDVIAIAEKAFKRNTNIKQIIINNIKKIEENAFIGCTNLTHVTIKNGLEIIEPLTFCNCVNLVECNLPITIKEIRVGAFDNCNKVRINMTRHKFKVKEIDADFLRRHIDWTVNENLNESRLNEIYSDTMPRWLIDVMKKDATIERHAWVGIDTRMHLSGIDLAHANFISGPVPTNSRDTRLKSPYIPFFHVVTEDEQGQTYDQAYAKGINDDERFYVGGKQSGARRFGSYSTKEILKYTKDFCYIDANDFYTNYKRHITDSRQEMKKELDKINYNRQTPDPLKNIDKSGYIVDPDKYRKKLTALGKENHQKVLDKLYNRLVDIKQQLADVLLDVDIRSDYNDLGALLHDRGFEKFVVAVNQFNMFSEGVDDALRISDENLRDERLGILFRAEDQRDNWGFLGVDVETVRKSIESLELSIKKHKTVIFEKLNEENIDMKTIKPNEKKYMVTSIEDGTVRCPFCRSRSIEVEDESTVYNDSKTHSWTPAHCLDCGASYEVVYSIVPTFVENETPFNDTLRLNEFEPDCFNDAFDDEVFWD